MNMCFKDDSADRAPMVVTTHELELERGLFERANGGLMRILPYYCFGAVS